jgi:hypothetical protein
MKNIYFTKVSFIIVMILLVAAFSSCRPKKVDGPSTGAVELTIPCQSEGRSDIDFFRADNSAKSRNMSLSREKALTMAKQRLSGLIESQIKSVTDRYVNEYEVGDAMDFSGKFENLTREVVNQTLINIAIICEKTFQETDGTYTTYIAIEVDKETLFNGFDKQIAKDQKLQVDYDKMKFEQIFNEEMDKMADERP